MATDAKRTLGGLTIGRSGHVKAVRAADRRMRRHIMDMGITPGTEVKLVKAAPMGDPLEIELRGYTMSLRRADADTILLMSDAEHEEWHARTLRARQEFEARAGERLAQTQPQESDAAGHRRAAEL
ncbi:MAG TPA: FeoA family protein, partial [Clostridia bacterium]|nr:FeoA family protein [Clostridia bacterium]